MSFRVRESKFRNIYGTNWKREQCYDNIRVSKSSWDSTWCAVNPKFIAVIVESAGGGAFIVFPLNKVGRIPIDFPLVGGHKLPVLDIAWCPHDDNIIASGSEDCLVRIWEIPDIPMSRPLSNPIVQLDYHQRRVGQVLWHPSAQNVLLSVGSDNLVVIWDVGQADPLYVINCHPDMVYSACWNYNGSQIVTTCKDRKVRVINPRTGDIITEGVCHEGTKASRAIFLKNGSIFTTGFSKTSERQYSLRSPEHLTEPIVMQDIDSSNGMMFPVYDPDHNLVYLCGKGDSVIRYYEVTTQAPYVHYISQHLMADPQRGFGVMPKRGLNTTQNEIARFYRLSNTGFCQVVSISVPRKSERFQEDLYPATAAEAAAITASQWFTEGQDAEPKLVSVEQKQESNKPEVRASRRTEGRVTRSTALQPSASSVPASEAQPASQSSSSHMVCPDTWELSEAREEIRKLKVIIVKHENRLRAAEAEIVILKERTMRVSSPPVPFHFDGIAGVAERLQDSDDEV